MVLLSIALFNLVIYTISPLVIETFVISKTIWASLVVQVAKNLPAMQETWVQSLGQEDSLEKGMAIHSSSLAWRVPWTEEPSRLWSMGWQRVGHD